MNEENKTYSVSLRVRRITHEDAYVTVPVTRAVTKQKENGTLTIDSEALVAEAIRISQDQRIEWKIESCQTEPHPAQIPKPEDRNSFGGH